VAVLPEVVRVLVDAQVRDAEERLDPRESEQQRGAEQDDGAGAPQRFASRPNITPATRRSWISSDPSVMR